MKRKNLFFVSALILFGLANVNSVKAQTNVATVNIKFRPIQSIVVNPGQETVNLVYETTANYNSGVSAVMNDHLTVFSTGGFEVNVRTNGNFKRGGVDLDAILAADVIVSASAGSVVNGVEDFKTAAGLTIGGNTLITANKGGRDLKYKVTYDNTAGGSDKYIDKYVAADGAESVYTATVTYTIAAK